MSPLATSFSRARRLAPLLWLLALQAASARVYLGVDEAVKLAFAEARVERHTIYLTKAEMERARELAAVEIQSALATAYEARREGVLVGTAYFDTHTVRTLKETIMVVVDAAGAVRRVEVLSFDEPPEYRPRPAWYAQFAGHALDGDLAVKRGIPAVTGATLTARATTDAVRRVLAIHRVLDERVKP